MFETYNICITVAEKYVFFHQVAPNGLTVTSFCIYVYGTSLQEDMQRFSMWYTENRQ